MEKIKIQWHKSINEFAQESWNKLIDNSQQPFFRWEWLNALEVSKTIVPKQGWQPLFLAVWEDNEPIAVAPLYLKAHSYGEFVFDQAFHQLANELGLQYYPKLLGMSPLSPIEGYKFFYKKHIYKEELTEIMMKEIDHFAIQNRILSCNFLYVDPQWKKIAKSCGCAEWVNRNSLLSLKDEKNFSDYLSKFNSNQRRNIKKERNFIKKANIKVIPLENININAKNMEKMHYFYQLHCARWGIWGSKYLAKEFFFQLTDYNLRDNIILFAAYKEQEDSPIGMSLCVKNENMLWGRYWGSEKEINCLHFETCFYSPIEWAIKNKIKFFDPGVGGSHKSRRGFLAKPHSSIHRWYNHKIDSIIRTWLPKANQAIEKEIKATNDEVPITTINPKLSSI